MDDDRFEILFVCHANLCRSPLAERLARRALQDAFGPAARAVLVSSAGTHAFEAPAMHEGSAAVLAECGIDAGGFTSRRLRESMVANADLVLTAGREQRANCVSLAPSALRRTFTLRQFTRLVAAVRPTPDLVAGPVPRRLHVLIDRVHDTRHLVPAVTAAEDDLPDPVNRPIEAFRDCAAEIWQSFGAVVGAIAAPRRGSGEVIAGS
ncbi:protein-tyrosine phosphatase [Krasilnikovia cinnamomea]|uniref:Protein-tyrosine phosphatase n=1 Tax=Krasilnikovia cinnamomea TaxID=349313 RepID=A0A4Q7ZJ42_9ACTN|nr:low molecular weight phosphatase family protein [Krasilnikovia cinnamomea]RZU50149.1 protein-tyrosine phosphatase [Krasilnikovia cinnamomea]